MLYLSYQYNVFAFLTFFDELNRTIVLLWIRKIRNAVNSILTWKDLNCKFTNWKIAYGVTFCFGLFWNRKHVYPFELLSYSNFIIAFSIVQPYESVFCKSTAGKSAVNDAAFPRQFVATRVQFRASVGKGAQFVSRKKIRSYESFSPWTSFLLLWPKKRGDDVFHADTSHVNKAGLFHDVPKFLLWFLI